MAGVSGRQLPCRLGEREVDGVTSYALGRATLNACPIKCKVADRKAYTLQLPHQHHIRDGQAAGRCVRSRAARPTAGMTGRRLVGPKAHFLAPSSRLAHCCCCCSLCSTCQPSVGDPRQACQAVCHAVWWRLRGWQGGQHVAAQQLHLLTPEWQRSDARGICRARACTGGVDTP